MGHIWPKKYNLGCFYLQCECSLRSWTQKPETWVSSNETLLARAQLIWKF